MFSLTPPSTLIFKARISLKCWIGKEIFANAQPHSSKLININIFQFSSSSLNYAGLFCIFHAKSKGTEGFAISTVSLNIFGRVCRYAFNLHLVGLSLKENICKIKRPANSAVTWQEIPVALQEGEVTADGQTCPRPAHFCCRPVCSQSAES